MKGKEIATWCEIIFRLAIIGIIGGMIFGVIYLIVIVIPNLYFKVNTHVGWLLHLVWWVGGGLSLLIGEKVAAKALTKIKILPNDDR